MNWFYSLLLLLCGAYFGLGQSVCSETSMFACDDNTCISRARTCDWSHDCPNGEDESAKAGCGNLWCAPRNTSLAIENSYPCRRRTCNPRRNNCPNGKECICDDECGFSCISPNSTCASDPPMISNSRGYEVIRKTAEGRTVLRGPLVFKHKDMIRYRCNNGRILVGPLVRCTSKRTWTTLLPQCKVDMCTSEGCLNGGTCVYEENGFFCHCPSTHVGGRCERERIDLCRDEPCLNGATCRTTRDERVECECTPRYTGQYCGEEVRCSQPPAPPDRGYIIEKERDEWRYDEEVTFECLQDFMLYGRNTIRCLSNGTWSLWAGKCRRMVCRLDYILMPNFVRVRGFDANELYNHKFQVDDEAKLRCIHGYRMLLNNQPFEPSKLQCTVGGDWIPSYRRISCELITCDLPGVMEGLDLSSDLFPVIVGTELNASCEEGYTFAGPRTVICLQDGTWSQLPSCTPDPLHDVTCQSPIMPDELHHESLPEANHFQGGEILDVRCSEGYILIGPKTIECRGNGTWSEFPRCEENLIVQESAGCSFELGDLRDGVEVELPDGRMQDSFPINDSLTIYCRYQKKRPYSVSNRALSQLSTCTSEGTWSPRIEDISCVQFCRRPFVPPGGFLVVNFHKEMYFPNETLHSECPDSYRHSGSNKIICLENGSWSETAPCQPVGCWIDPKLVHETIVFDGHDDVSLSGVEFPSGHEMGVICVNQTLEISSGMPQKFVCEGKNTWSQDYTQYACQARSCQGRCNSHEGVCACDFNCEDRQDCCDDFEEYCYK